MYGDIVINNIRNVMLFTGVISLVVLLLCGGILCDTRTYFHLFDSGSMNSFTHIEGIRLNYMVPYMPFVRADSLFMQDNAHPHMV